MFLFLFRIVCVSEAPSTTVTSECFKLLLWCMKVLALTGSSDAEDKGPQRKMSARHLSSSCFPSPLGHRSMQCMLGVWVVSSNEEILLEMLKYWAALEPHLPPTPHPRHCSSCHPSCDSALAQGLNDCALTTELHGLGTLPHLRITKQLLSLHLNGPGHLAGVLPKGSILSNPQAKCSNLPLWTRARTVCLTVSSQLLSSWWDKSWIVGWCLSPSNSQIESDRWAVTFICPARNSCAY